MKKQKKQYFISLKTDNNVQLLVVDQNIRDLETICSID